MTNFIKICGGSITYKIGDHVEFAFNKVEDYEKNLKGRDKYEELFKGSVFHKDIEEDINTPSGLVEELVRQWKISMAVIHSGAFLHNQICKLYLKIIDKSGKKINETHELKPSNYTEASARLASITWNTYKVNKLQGPCPCEIDVRLKQLADFPIHEFACGDLLSGLKMRDIPKKPAIKTAKFQSTQLYGRLKDVRKDLEAQEKYYTSLLPKIEELSEKIMEMIKNKK